MLFVSFPPSLSKLDCTYSHFEHSSSCPTCRKQLGENDFTELVVAENYEALTNENTRLKQQQTSLRLQYEQNLNDMQNKLMAKERTITEQHHRLMVMKTREILDDCNSPSPEKPQRQEVLQQRYRSFADMTNDDEDGEIVADYAAAEAVVERRNNHAGDGVAAGASQQQRKDETTVSTILTSGNNMLLRPQMEGEDDNGSMTNPTNDDTTLTTEKRTSKRGSRGKNSRKQYNSRRRNGVGRNGEDGGGHGDNMRRRIS